MSQNLSNNLVDLQKLAAALGITVEALQAAQEAAKPDKASLAREVKALRETYDAALLAFVTAEEAYIKAAAEKDRLFREYESIASKARLEGVTAPELDKRLTEKRKAALLGKSEELTEEQKEEAKPEKPVGKFQGKK